MPSQTNQTPDTQKLLTLDFVLLFFLALFSNCYLAVYYCFEQWLVKVAVDPHWRGLLLGILFGTLLVARPCAIVFLLKRNKLPVVIASLLVSSGVLFSYQYLDPSSPFFEWTLLGLRILQGTFLALFSTSVVSVLVSCIPPGQSARGFALYLWHYPLLLIMNPATVVEMEEGSHMEMETSQIKGVDSTRRTTNATLAAGATLVVHEKIMTHGDQFAETHFTVDLNGAGCGAHVVSRSVAKDRSRQSFYSDIRGNNRCSGHTECDAIIMDRASVTAIPQIVANHVDASLIHEAAIGKIAGEQLIKLMTLGLTEAEAVEAIINGFLR